MYIGNDLIGIGNNLMVGATVAVTVAIEEACKSFFSLNLVTTSIYKKTGDFYLFMLDLFFIICEFILIHLMINTIHKIIDCFNF